jgi:uncharacterized small protein (DUF1192 family)
MLTDDDRPVRPAAYTIGQDLATLSVEDLGERIALLRAEIARLEAAVTAKTATRAAAEGLFRLG